MEVQSFGCYLVKPNSVTLNLVKIHVYFWAQAVCFFTLNKRGRTAVAFVLVFPGTFLVAGNMLPAHL